MSSTKAHSTSTNDDNHSSLICEKETMNVQQPMQVETNSEVPASIPLPITNTTLSEKINNNTQECCLALAQDSAAAAADTAADSAPSLTAELLAEQNELYSSNNLLEPNNKPNSISAWAADLPQVPDSVQPILTTSYTFEMEPLNENTENSDDTPRIQETKDVFTETQKIAYVGLCYLTSLEVVHDFPGKAFTYARMSADNWQRKIMRMLYSHMDISSDEIKMIESLSKHDILPTDLVHQFTSQGETAEVKLDDINKKHTLPGKEKEKNSVPQQKQQKENTCTNDDKDVEKMENTSTEEQQTEDDQSIETKVDKSEDTIHSIDNTQLRDDQYQQQFKNEQDDLSKKQEKIVIDLCWTVMCDLFLLCLGTENYDARSRVFVARIAAHLSLDWFQVIGFEKRIAEHLIQDTAAWETETVTSVATTMTAMTMTNTDKNGAVKSDIERAGRNKQRKKKRYVMIGLATIGGGLILGLSAGLMAPVIAGGLGALLTTVGVTGTGSFLGGTAGIALITGSATLAGGRIGGRGMNRRMKAINTFEFLPVHIDENVNSIISIAGWLPNKDKEEASLPYSTLDPLMGDHYALYWEPEMLEELGSAFRIFATEAVTFSIQQALGHTIMSTLLAGLAWPLALTKLGYMVDNPWANSLDRARIAGLILADSLMNRNLGARPITLVGFSLGARVIFYCLEELARVKAYGLIENVALFGTPVSASNSQWKECTTAVSGRFINGYATNDWLLGFLFRTTTAGLGSIAGLRPLSHIEGNRVQNVDCTDLVTGHLSYRSAMPRLLKRAGFVVTSEEMPVREKEDNSKESQLEEEVNATEIGAAISGDIKNKRLDSTSSSLNTKSSLSSLSSGKASIQLSTKPATPLATEISDDCGRQSDNMPTRTDSSSTAPATPGNQTPRTSDEPKNFAQQPTTITASDYDIIADIIANATAAASSKSGTYSSLSSGKASIASTPTTSTFDSTAAAIATASKSSTTTSTNNMLSRQRSTLAGFFSSSSSKSETTLEQVENNKPPLTPKSRSSMLFGSSSGSTLFLKKKASIIKNEDEKELEKAGVVVKEIKGTLPLMVVPNEIANPMPRIKLEAPQNARLNK